MEHRTRRVSLLVIAVVVSGAVAVPATASATPATPSIDLSPAVGPPTSSVTVTGSGFGASETVVIRFDHNKIASSATDGSGSFTADVIVPVFARPGGHQVRVTGASSGDRASAPFLVRTDWPQFHVGAGHQGSNPYENVLGPSNVQGLAPAWSYPAAGSCPVVAGGRLFIASSDGLVHALNATTGKQVWSYSGGGACPAVVNGMVYLVADSTVYALNAGSGALVWQFKDKDNELTGSPAVSDGVVYVTGNYAILYALDAATGDQRWVYHPPGSYNFGATSPAVGDGLVYVASYEPKPETEGWLTAVNTTTGKAQWSFHVFEEIRTTPAVGDTVVAFPSFDHRHLYVVDAASGALIWSRSMRRTFVIPTPVLSNGVLYVADAARRFWTFDEFTGAVIRSKWTAAGDCAVANGVIYLSTNDGHIDALSTSNLRLLWESPGGGSLVVVNGMVYDGSGAFALP